ncbi:unnamed protein product [Orchesella dallaii]|uniref:Uncharacterized protein n=1 Tax=Orchesella dallaii TaxID=48710 RepID=A0ABP1QT23_9HEXA
MSPVNSYTMIGCLILVFSSGILNYNVDCKPTDGVGVITTKSFQPSQSIPPHSSDTTGRKVLTSWNEDGSWQASARLPTSSQTGGNDHSRYKIRRDGSLSLALQIPKPQFLFGTNFHQGSLAEPSSTMTSNWARDNRVPSNAQIGQRASSSTTRQFSPAELRSFSVVISDVDVTGNYNNDEESNQDAYSKAGVSSYHLKSNSIHRMNASWKLKAGHPAPTSTDLLEFLSYFANGDRATRSEHLEQQEPHQQEFQKPLRKILGQYEAEGSEKDEEDNGENKQPFLTWSESSRKIPLSSTEVHEKANSSSSLSDISIISTTDAISEDLERESTTVLEPSYNVLSASTSLKENPSSTPIPINVEATTDTQYEESTSTRRNEAKVVLHELISTLEKLNENVDEEENQKTSVDIENSSANQRKNASSIHEDVVDTASQPQLQQQQTELDQTTTESESKQEHEQQVYLEMTESLQKEAEKEVDAFAKDDTAKFANYTNTTHNSTSFASHDDDHQHEYTVEEEGKKNARSAFLDSKTKSTKSTYRNGRNNNNATSTSTTSLESVNSQQRMKITDPQQTASDLKKLMSLILKSDGNRNGGGGGGSVRGDANKSGTQVVNIVITPNQDAFSSSSDSPQLKNNPQKILFLKTPQVKQMLDIALSDPAVSSAAHKIAAALESNPFPNPIPTNIDHTYNSLPSYIINHNENNNEMQHASITNQQSQSDTSNNENDNNVPSTPDGFPLTGTGFLNLHHPNLQFHQALHHLIVNGTAPTSINATTKTNVINIFVINFKENDHETGGYPPGISPINQSPLRINIKPQQAQRPKPPFPIDIKPILIESVSPTPDPSLFFHSKMGLAEAVAAATDNQNYEFDDNIANESPSMIPEKYYAPSRNSAAGTLVPLGRPHSDKINIFDLLPGDIGTATAVQYAPGVEIGDKDQTHNHNQTMPTIHISDSKLSTVKPATVPYTDYFADFLPDRSRDPGNEKPHQPQESENLSEHDILSFLASSRIPVTTPSTAAAVDTFTSLPPSLAHLEWIFKNQPPPKPQIPQSTLLKRKGTTTSGETGSIEEADVGSDSMMEQDETSNAPFHGGTTQELVEYLLKLQNVTKSTDFNLLESNYTIIPNKQPMDIGDAVNLTKIQDNASDSEEHQIIEYTTKPPAFWKFGSKIPLGGFSNANEAINNRLRKVMTAFGYSALPTLAAGAAATWPYWVPLVAAGRRRRRRSPFSQDEKFSEIVLRNSSPLSKLMTAESSNSLGKNGTTTSTNLRSSNRQLLSKSTKNNRREGVGEQKWIKVDVITTSNPFVASSSSPSLISTSSPTLLRSEMNSHPHHHYNQQHPTENGTSFHSLTYNSLRTKNNKNDSNNRFNMQDYNVDNSTQKQRLSQHQLDLPLLKNFLKNVLYNEFSMSTSAPPLLHSPSLSPIPSKNAQKLEHEHHYIHHPATFPLSSAESSSSSTPTGPVALSQYPIFTTNLNQMKNGHPFNGGITTQTQNANNSPVLLNTFSRPSSSSSFPEKQYNNNGGDEQMIAGSDKKVISISAFSTPSPTSVYIHNRGDGTTSTTNTVASSTASPSLVELQRNPWGSSFGRPDKVSSTVTTTFTNTPHGTHSAQTQIFNGANNIDYHVDHYHQLANKGKQKVRLADAIRTAERSYTSAALFPLWFPILFGSQSQVSSKLKEVIKKQHLKGF